MEEEGDWLRFFYNAEQALIHVETEKVGVYLVFIMSYFGIQDSLNM